jgi:Tfp pilus assembly protein PilX
MTSQPPANRSRLSRLLGRVAREERGISLVLALLITTALTISTAALATLVTSNEHAFGRDRQEALGFNTAEAGLNYAIAYLAQTSDPNGAAAANTQVPSQAGPYVAFSSTRPTSYTTFGASTPQGTGSGEWWAEKTGAHTWTIWATGLSPDGKVIRELSQKVLSTTQPGTFEPASLAWSYGLFVSNPGPGCFTPQGTADITISVYVNGCIKVSGSAGIQEPTTSTGNTIKVFALTSISVTGSAEIGKSTKKIKSITALNCTDGNGKSAANCSQADTAHVHSNQYNGTGAALTKPAVNADTVYAKADWKNGPVCTTTGGTSFPVFDNDTTRNTGAPNPNLFPGNDYDCIIYATSAHSGTPVGTLKWENGPKHLTASGTIFFDTNLQVSNGAASYTAGTSATIYVDGTVTMNGNAALCGPPATPSGSTCTGGPWQGTQGAIVIAALNHNNASPAWKANGNVEYDVAAYVIGLYQNNGGATVTGPVVTDTALVAGTGNSSDVSDPPDTAPGGKQNTPGQTSWAVIPATWQQLKPT